MDIVDHDDPVLLDMGSIRAAEDLEVGDHVLLIKLVELVT